MSDQNGSNIEIKEVAPPQPPHKNAELDLYALFKQVDNLREEGVPEDVIRDAFNEFMAEHHGKFRVPLKRILKTSDSLPMPSQVDINKMYEDRYKKPAISEDMEMLMEEVQNAGLARKNKNSSFLKRMAYTVAYVLLKAPVSFAIWVLKKINSDDDSEDNGSGFGGSRDD